MSVMSKKFVGLTTFVWCGVWLVGLAFPFFAHSDLSTIYAVQLIAWPVTLIFFEQQTALGFVMTSLCNFIWSAGLATIFFLFCNILANRSK